MAGLGTSRILLPWEPRPFKLWQRIFGLSVATLGVALAVLPAALLPVPVLPDLTGSFAVGHSRYEWTDASREELYSPTPGQKRSLAIDLYYPAEPLPGTTPEPPWHDLLPLVKTMAESVGLGWLPTQVADQFDLAHGRAWRDAPLTSGPSFPVLLYSPGYGGPVGFYFSQTAELASHGYVVVAISHPYQNLTVYPDGRVLQNLDEKSWLKLSDAQIAAINKQYGELYQEFLSAKSIDEARPLVAKNQELRRKSLLPANLQLWADDSRFALDQVERLNHGDLDSRFQGRLDLSRVGALGHSFGGATAGELVLTDPRVKAGVNLDGTQEGTVEGHALPNSFLLIEEGEPVGHVGNMINKVLYEASPGPFYTVDVDGVFHNNFSDGALWGPLLTLVGMTAPIDGTRVVKLTNQIVVEFFEQELRGHPSTMLASPGKKDGWSLTKRLP